MPQHLIGHQFLLSLSQYTHMYFLFLGSKHHLDCHKFTCYLQIKSGSFKRTAKADTIQAFLSPLQLQVTGLGMLFPRTVANHRDCDDIRSTPFTEMWRLSRTWKELHRTKCKLQNSETLGMVEKQEGKEMAKEEESKWKAPQGSPEVWILSSCFGFVKHERQTLDSSSQK